jgi:hypothetical protein
VDGAPVGYMYREQPDKDVDLVIQFNSRLTEG